MSTRQLRLNSTDVILKKLQELTGKKINIVLNDSTVILGTVLGTDESLLEVLNMRLKKIKIPLQKINEIYYDTKE
jgi:hypothetical protein